jgi:succinyl-diaminopimelate desuccinylase
MPAMAPDLATRALELVSIPSVSHEESELAAYVAAAMPWEPAFADDDLSTVYARRDGKPLVVFGGHLDTVPPQENLPGRLEDGWVVGLGSCDMKGGVALMIELARWLAEAEPETAVDPAFLFFPREELGAEWNPLPGLFEACPLLGEAALAVLLEPTDETIQAGCLGNVVARRVFTGKSAHSARPWLGENAIFKAVEAVVPVAPEEVEIDGLRFVEVLSPTLISGGIAANVIPDRVEVTYSYRFAPHRSMEEAEARVRELLGGDVEVLSVSPAGRVSLRNPQVERLRAATGFAVEPKQAWTNVADFTARGVDAVNLGPGQTRYAHTRDERVEVAALERTFEALQRFVLAGSV